MDTKAGARQCPENMNLWAKIIPSSLLILVEEAGSYEREKHASNGRFRKIALLNQLGQPGTRRCDAPDEQEQGCCPVDSLGSVGGRTVDTLDGNRG
jgi:hypothetical protein